MKLFLFVLFLFVYPLFSQSQEAYDRGDILVKKLASWDQSNWSFFSDTENVEDYIGFRNELFGFQGVLPLVIGEINFDKKQLIQVEQELALYKLGKQGLSPSMITLAGEAIDRHWAAIGSIEDEIRSIGLEVSSAEVTQMRPLIGEITDYREGVWELYQADRDVVSSLVSKDGNVYNQLNRDDEAYAAIIAPFVERYASSMTALAQDYSSASVLWESSIDNLTKMYTDSFEVYKGFNQNFKNPTTRYQQDILRAIQGWHTAQGNLGAGIIINAYQDHEGSSIATIEELELFRDAPNEVKERVGGFLRTEFLNNEAFIATEDAGRVRTRTEALISLKDFDILSTVEKKIFAEALNAEIIVNPFVDYRGYYYSTDRPLP